MSWDGVPDRLKVLAEAAQRYFESENAMVRVMEPIAPNLNWRPHLAYDGEHHQIVAAEAAESPYPDILKIRVTDLLHRSEPISVYSICPSDALGTPRGHSEKRELREHGFGLLVVDPDGNVSTEFSANPLIQHISSALFEEHLEAFPKKQHARLRAAYKMYCDEPIAGVRELSELVEGSVFAAVKIAIKKGWVKAGVAGKLAADQLDAIYEAHEFHSARAAIGGARSYIKTYRNPVSHFPRSRKAAITRYRSVRIAFLMGLTALIEFQKAMATCGVRATFLT